MLAPHATQLLSGTDARVASSGGRASRIACISASEYSVGSAVSLTALRLREKTSRNLRSRETT